MKVLRGFRRAEQQSRIRFIQDYKRSHPEMTLLTLGGLFGLTEGRISQILKKEVETNEKKTETACRLRQ